MATAAQMRTIADMSEAELNALAYLEEAEAEGDAERALGFAVEDLLRAEGDDLAVARRAISHGYVRAGAMSAPADRVYLCHTRGCVSVHKSIPRARIEDEFETLLRSLQPSPRLSALAKAMFRSAWDQRKAQAEGTAARLRACLRTKP